MYLIYFILCFLIKDNYNIYMKNKFFLSFITVDNDSINQRIDNFLFKKIKHISKNKIYVLLRKGNIRVNKKRILPKYKLKINDVIRIPLIKLNITKYIYISKKNILKFKKMIIYEDNYLLVINKPYGISVHGGTGIGINIIDVFRNNIYYQKYLELIHRIDKDCSGILLLAKNRKILCNLQNDFKFSRVIKKYFVLVHGIWPFTKKIVKDFVCVQNGKKKVSKTIFKFLKYISNYTLLSIQTLTGRNHQIRLHVKYLGFPIVFDRIYGNKNLDKLLFSKIKVNRLFLHAYYISFLHPFLNIKKKFFVHLDKKLLLILEKINKINI